MDIQKSLGSLRRFFSSGKTLSAEYRLNALANLEKAIRAREEEILAALARDLGKSRTEGYMTELGMVYSELSYMRRHVKKLMRPVRAKTPTAQLPAKSFSLPCPYGTALIVSPWNYPFQLTMVPLVDCIAAGNCALVKPSASAAETAKIIGTILKEAFPPEYVSVAEGDRKENADLTSRPPFWNWAGKAPASSPRTRISAFPRGASLSENCSTRARPASLPTMFSSIRKSGRISCGRSKRRPSACTGRTRFPLPIIRR